MEKTTSNTVQEIKKELQKLSSKKGAESSARFFKTGVGQYGYGDVFIGVSLPNQRIIAKRFASQADLEDVSYLLQSDCHEHRLTGLLILVAQFQKSKNEGARKEIYDFYLKNTVYINNWDLVDVSCYHIVGEYLQNKDQNVLKTLAKSGLIWERRIGIVSTFAFIKKGESQTALEVVDILLHDPEDLIHKACGWMLREIGKRSGEKILKDYLHKNKNKLPRTTLRYAIEKFSDDERGEFLKK